jgi:hypothetical protein
VGQYRRGRKGIDDGCPGSFHFFVPHELVPHKILAIRLRNDLSILRSRNLDLLVEWRRHTREISNVFAEIRKQTQSGFELLLRLRFGHLPYRFGLVRVCGDTVFRNDVSQELDLLRKDFALAGSKEQPVLVHSLENLVECLDVFLVGPSVHDAIVDVGDTRIPLETSEDFIDESAESRRSLFDALGHASVLIHPIWAQKGSEFFRVVMEGNTPERIYQVKS